ncbi:hypothetical protein [Helicobacter sp. NHP22-001]|uniref:hypothetical protein n=1 Tax=Helicobacter sp. NHP22-001 TaxID=3040202 RepID=UPI00244D85BB|nr:hypothetical protein [Helicobacter sp. NHP22-001]GMB96760.1 hypothetical protein NHP22001_13490 [Helicobacter sp. NHP22-001]
MELIKGKNYDGNAFLKLVYKDLSTQEKFREIAAFGPRYSLRGYQQEFIVKFFAFYDLYKQNKKIALKVLLIEHLQDVIEKQGESCKDVKHVGVLRQRFEKTVDFIVEHDLIDREQYKQKKKEKLLPIMLAVALYLDGTHQSESSNIQDSQIWTSEFEKRANEATLSSLSANVAHVLSQLCSSKCS